MTHLLQKLIKGYTDEELKNLDRTLFEWIIPRLERFKEITNNCPPDFKNLEEWRITIQTMINAFKLDLEEFPEDKEEQLSRGRYIVDGFYLFYKYFFYLRF